MSGSHTEIIKLGFFLITAFVTIIFVFYDILFMEIPDEVLIPANIILFFLLFLMSVDGLSLPIFEHFKTFHNDIFNIPLVNAMMGAGGVFAFFYIQILISKGRWMGG